MTKRGFKHVMKLTCKMIGGNKEHIVNVGQDGNDSVSGVFKIDKVIRNVGCRVDPVPEIVNGCGGTKTVYDTGKTLALE